MVHRAIQPHVGREVAVKVINPELANDPEFVRRFEAEAQIVARLEHPHIVPLYDYWRDPDGAYLVMRYLSRGSLRQRLESGTIASEELANLVDQICQALAAAHRQGIVHRDVKPGERAAGRRGQRLPHRLRDREGRLGSASDGDRAAGDSRVPLARADPRGGGLVAH